MCFYSLLCLHPTQPVRCKHLIPFITPPCNTLSAWLPARHVCRSLSTLHYSGGTISLDLGLANYSRPPVFMNKALLECGHGHFLHIVYGCFHATVAELRGGNRDWTACQAQNVYYFVVRCGNACQAPLA